MGRGIERRKIFLNTKDRNDFIARLGQLAEERSMDVYAWAFLSNHAHFLLLCKTNKRPLSSGMRKLLTGYVVNFNKRHRRPCQSPLTGQAWLPFSEPVQIHRMPGRCIPAGAGPLHSSKFAESRGSNNYRPVKPISLVGSCCPGRLCGQGLAGYPVCVVVFWDPS